MSILGVVAFVAVIIGVVVSVISWSGTPVLIGAAVFLILAVVEAARQPRG